MVWKQDLAKLKQAFRETGGPPPPAPKPKPKPLESKDLNDEDAMFLAAMGAPAPAAPKVSPTPSAPPPPMEPALSFEDGLADLRGLKPMARNPVMGSAAPAPALLARVPVSVEAAAPETRVPALLPAPDPVLASRAPVRIQLAAGMAVEVDAALDLRGHSVPDALGRLRDRLEDGALLGWRTLHLILGEDAALHEALLAFLASGAASRIGRYAQAPIPMGGGQAWVLYY